MSKTHHLTSLTLVEAAARIKSRAASSTQLTEQCLSRIGTFNPKVNAFITVTGEHALARARELDREQRAGTLRGPLHGIPIAVKDNIDTAGIRTTAASALFDDRVPQADAEIARRLAAAGAVLIGKTNLHEFGTGGSGATSYYGPVRNPWALDRSSGGSSGGSAAAVATELCFGAVGTDTGGSIRTPASFCGVVGLKPTYGLVSLRGIIPLSPTLDHCGPIARTVADAAVLLDAIAGYDKLDLASVDHAKSDHVAALKQPVKQLRLGVARAPFFDLLDPEVGKAVEEAIGALGRLTRSVRDVTLPSTMGIGTVGVECFVYHEEYLAHSAGLYQIPTRRSLQSAAGLSAAEYLKARWKLDLLRRTIDDVFDDFDVVIVPTRRRTPRTIDATMRLEASEEPHNPEMENPGAFNLYGIPAISIPCGFTSANLPVGLTIAGPRFSEGRVLSLAHAFERATEWHKRRPPLTPKTTVPPLATTGDA
jgi:aspartyl-tRNA(Asn)/glutamyl-tRNA(Gln) amidotransferase subunit A